MMFRVLSIATALAIGVSALPAFAHAGEVYNRERFQQRRIAQGIGSGQLTAGETARLERREAAINQSRTNDLRAHGGHLTPAEYRNLNGRLNSVSRQIYWDKHNGARQH